MEKTTKTILIVGAVVLVLVLVMNSAKAATTTRVVTTGQVRAVPGAASAGTTWSDLGSLLGGVFGGYKAGSTTDTAAYGDGGYSNDSYNDSTADLG